MLYYRRPKEPVAAAGVERSDALNFGLVLAVLAGMAIATQVVVNSIGLRDLGIGSLVGISGFATGVVGLGLALPAGRPEITSEALACAAVSGVLGAFILGSIVLAANEGGIARTLSLVIASQLIAGLVIDRSGLFGETAQQIGPARIVGVTLILVGGIRLVRD
jgi:transporter family-2 protein